MSQNRVIPLLIHTTIYYISGSTSLMFLPFSGVFQDPEASYDVNDGDADPQPRYTQRNENR